jgi:hypothetical protein
MDVLASEALCLAAAVGATWGALASLHLAPWTGMGALHAPLTQALGRKRRPLRAC